MTPPEHNGSQPSEELLVDELLSRFSGMANLDPIRKVLADQEEMFESALKLMRSIDFESLDERTIGQWNSLLGNLQTQIRETRALVNSAEESSRRFNELKRRELPDFPYPYQISAVGYVGKHRVCMLQTDPTLYLGTAGASAEVVLYASDYNKVRFDRLRQRSFAFADLIGIEGLVIEDRLDGSRYERFRGKIKAGVDSRTAQDLLAEAQAAMAIEISGMRQAEMDALNGKTAADMLASVGDEDEACLQNGALLVLKVRVPGSNRFVITTQTLSALEMKVIRENRGVLMTPSLVLESLAVAVRAELEGGAQPPMIGS